MQKTTHTTQADTEKNVVRLLSQIYSSSTTSSLNSEVQNLQQHPGIWLKNDTLRILCMRLFALYTCDHALVTGEMAAALAKRLLAAEQQPGGPYNASDDLLHTNAAIAQLFRALGSPLPNVEAYITQSITKDQLFHHPETAWIFIWPYQFVPDISVKVFLNDPRTKSLSTDLRHLLELPPHPVSRSAPAKISPTTAAVRDDIQHLPREIREMALRSWLGIAHVDKRHEISELNRMFADSLTLPVDANTPIKALSMATYYAWMAYTIYDDFIDDEGIPSQLPIANFMHRRSLQLFQSAVKQRQHFKVIEDQFNDMDIANAWELQHCRYSIKNGTITVTRIPMYRTRLVLYKRAGAHALGPQLLLHLLPDISAEQQRAVKTCLVHYIIARQLNDDLHDWKEDLANGHISFVVAFLLKKVRVTSGTHSIEQLTESMKKYFWEQGLSELLDIIDEHLAQSYDSLAQSTIMNKNSAFVHATLTPIEESVKQSRETIDSQKDFLTTYAGCS